MPGSMAWWSGLASLGLGAYLLSQGQIDDVIRKAGADPRNVPPQMQVQVSAIRLLNYCISGGFALMGVVFIVLGALAGMKYQIWRLEQQA